MQYFKIPKKLDNIYLNNNKRNILVHNELITIKEAKKMNLYTFLSKNCPLVNINKNKTYFFFGARKSANN